MMDDSMDIEPAVCAASASAPLPPPPGYVTAAALALLAEGLGPFVTEQARRALGDDMYEFYLPPPGVDIAGLLRYVRSKWLGIFADSVLEPQRAALERLEDVAHASRKAVNPLPGSFSDAAVADIQAVLLAMRKPGLAAKVGLLQPGEGKKPTPSRQGLSAVAPPPQQDYVQHAPQHQAQPERQQQPLAEATPPGAQFEQKMPIALDGSNIAWRHGVSRRFSIRGVAEALAYFTQRGHPCVVFLPEGRLRDPPRAPESGDALPEGELEAFNALKALEGSPVLVLTPEKDYDDCYITHFAREYQAVVVSNDRFEDQVYQAEAEGSDAAEEWRQWIAACRLPFTFHGHAFVPNPVFSMERAALVANDLSRQASSDPRRP